MEKTAIEWLVEILDKEMSERNKFDDFAWVFEDIIHQAMDIEQQQNNNGRKNSSILLKG